MHSVYHHHCNITVLKIQYCILSVVCHILRFSTSNSAFGNKDKVSRPEINPFFLGRYKAVTEHPLYHVDKPVLCSAATIGMAEIFVSRTHYHVNIPNGKAGLVGIILKSHHLKCIILRKLCFVNKI